MELKNIENLYAVLYSRSRNAYEVMSLREMIESNIRTIVRGDTDDRLMVGYAPTREESSRLAAEFREIHESHDNQALLSKLPEG